MSASKVELSKADLIVFPSLESTVMSSLSTRHGQLVSRSLQTQGLRVGNAAGSRATLLDQKVGSLLKCSKSAQLAQVEII